MTTKSDRPGQPPVAGGFAPEIARLWDEPRRVEQIARINGLQLQTCDQAGQNAWEQAARIHAQLPDGVRLDLPSSRVFARVLGFYRSAATLKNRPMVQLELSVKDIAAAIGYGKSVVEAALRWLGSETILYRGQQVARGLGYISRARRKAKAYVQGVLQNVYRTSQTCLTFLGRGILGLMEIGEESQRSVPPGRRKRLLSPPEPGPQAAPVIETPNWDVGLAAIQMIKMML